jgi:ribosomal protein S18
MLGDEVTHTQFVLIIVALITTVIAPTWLSWWNSRVQKKEMMPNGGSSFRDEFNVMRKQVTAHGKILDRQNTKLDSIQKEQEIAKGEIKRIQKDHLLLGFNLGARSMVGENITGEVPVIEEDNEEEIN